MLIIYDKSLFYIDSYEEESNKTTRYYFKDLESLYNSYSVEDYKIINEEFLVSKAEINNLENNELINEKVLKEKGILYKSF